MYCSSAALDRVAKGCDFDAMKRQVARFIHFAGKSTVHSVHDHFKVCIPFVLLEHDEVSRRTEASAHQTLIMLCDGSVQHPVRPN